MGQMEGMEVVVMEVDDDDDVEERENGVEKEEEVKWENFMPRMVLRVLLVEADDSTRQIVGALLRKCNYKVAAISDGLKAWEILKRRHNNIDLILTELDLPSISGYALLTLIMEHDSCKDIPVIIMSSQDSVSMVLKCILKGAADFLIKPIRKNELKNLWRHAWRKLTNNGGHNTQNLNAEQHKTEATREKNPATNHSGDNVSSSHNSSKFSEKSADAHGLSRMKHREETEICQRKEKLQAKKVKVEGVSLHTSVTEDKPGSDAQRSKEVNVSTALGVEEDGSDTGIATEDGRSDNGPENHTYGDNIAGDELFESSTEAVDLIGRINDQKSMTGRTSSSTESNGKITYPELELYLKRPLDSEAKEVYERPILNHSSASAFSWYGTNKKIRTSIGASDGGLPKIESGEYKPNINVPQLAHRDPFSPQHHIGLVPLSGLKLDNGVWASYGNLFQSLCSSHKGPTSISPSLALQREASPFSASPLLQSESGIGAGYGNALQPICSSQKGPTSRSPNSALQREESSFLTSPSLQSDPGTHSSNQGCGRAGDELKTAESVEQHGCSSSQVVDPSGSGIQCNDIDSRNKNTAQGSSSEITEVNASAFGMKGTSFVEKSEDFKPFIHEQFKSSMGIHSAEREAALAKFRQKRKGRCYEKKVPYQSRKRLAEQRPRVKGQFVRQVPCNQALTDDKP